MSANLTYKESPTLTRLLNEARGGSRRAMEEIIPLVYEELRQLAHGQRALLKESTLNTTALVHELFVLLQQRESLQHWKDRRHFFATAALAMRSLLVDHARAMSAQKRGSGISLEPLRDNQHAEEAPYLWLLQLDQALDTLAKHNPRARDIVELRFFTGLDEAEVARQLQISRSTAAREWRKARAWLSLYMEHPPGME